VSKRDIPPALPGTDVDGTEGGFVRLTCRTCRRMCSRSYDKDRAGGDLLGRPWYVDETGLKHLAIACLHCGTIHDCTGSLVAIFSGGLRIRDRTSPVDLALMVRVQRSAGCAALRRQSSGRTRRGHQRSGRTQSLGTAFATAPRSQPSAPLRATVRHVRAKRHVPILAGLLCLTVAAVLLLGLEAWWRHLLVVPLTIFGCFSLRIGFFASDRQVRQLTGGRLGLCSHAPRAAWPHGTLAKVLPDPRC
jgi:hypothetical protein